MKTKKMPNPSGKGSGVVYIKEFLEADITTPYRFRIPGRTTSEGWIKSCGKCGRPFLQYFRAGTVRGPRAELCTSCWIEGGCHV